MSQVALSKITPRNKFDNLIYHWLQERQQLIVLFNQLCRHKSDMAKPAQRQLIKRELEYFCSVLVDYIAVGQFAVSLRIVEEIEAHPASSATVPAALLDKLRRLSLYMVDFNDQYKDCMSFKTLEQDLSSLGLHLAKRFELEDWLLKIYTHVKNEKPHFTQHRPKKVAS